jgi:hypothetical protein
LVEGGTSEVKLLAANSVALVELELARIRKTRAVLSEAANPISRGPRGAVEHLFSTRQAGPQGQPYNQLADHRCRLEIGEPNNCPMRQY